MGVFKRSDSRYYWLWLPRGKGKKGVRERTQILATPENSELAQRVYHERMKNLAETFHFKPRRLHASRTDSAGWCYVYFVSDGHAIKIGRAVNVLARLRSLQTSHHAPLTILATFLTHDSIEARLHHQFKSVRIAREWYQPVPALLALIEEIKRGGDVITKLLDFTPSSFTVPAAESGKSEETGLKTAV